MGGTLGWWEGRGRGCGALDLPGPMLPELSPGCLHSEVQTLRRPAAAISGQWSPRCGGAGHWPGGHADRPSPAQQPCLDPGLFPGGAVLLPRVGKADRNRGLLCSQPRVSAILPVPGVPSPGKWAKHVLWPETSFLREWRVSGMVTRQCLCPWLLFLYVPSYAPMVGSEWE